MLPKSCMDEKEEDIDVSTALSSRVNDNNQNLDQYLEMPTLTKKSAALNETAAPTQNSQSKRVILNVGGERHEMLWTNLNRHKNTRLGQLKARIDQSNILDLCDDYCREKNEYYWDRSSQSFSLILNLYRKNKIHLPDDFCAMDFAEELQYWGIDDVHLDSCCGVKYTQKVEHIQDQMKKDKAYFSIKEDDFGHGATAWHRSWVWDLFEKSKTIPQKAVGTFSITMIVLSIMTLCLSTIGDLHEYRCKHENVTLCEELLQSSYATTDLDDFEQIDNPIFYILELGCVIWFTIEYLLKMFAAPSKPAFFRSWLNGIDLLAIVPFYVSLILVQNGMSGQWLQMLRAIRIMRIFKLVRHSTGLQCLGYTLRHSYQYLGVLLLFLSMGVIIFSTLAYFAENGVNPEGFESIPQSFYWALITMTTIGYGDISPVSILGKVIASLTGICGVVAIALPIPTVVNNFTKFYEEHKRQQRALKRQKARLKMKSNSVQLMIPMSEQMSK